MGMDVYGLNPTSDEGVFFRRNVWGWRPLVDLCQWLAPNIVKSWQAWHSNEGAGLDANGASELAMQLESAVSSGRIGAYVEGRNAQLAQMSDEPCEVCDGTGVRTDDHGAKRIPCNICNGQGQRRPWATWYDLEESDVLDFLSLLKSCGGFEIW